MKHFEVKYIKGHLTDVKTNKRIFLKRGGTFQIQGNDNLFEEKDELFMEDPPLDSEDKLEFLQKHYPNHVVEKVAEAGLYFRFSFGLSKKTSEDETRSFVFNALIEEDLYMMTKNGINWTLSPCKCITTECLDGDMQMIEAVQGTSLSNLFGNVVTFYFAMQRSTACNAFNTFKTINPYSSENFYGRFSRMSSLEDIRQNLIRENEEEIQKK